MRRALALLPLLLFLAPACFPTTGGDDHDAGPQGGVVGDACAAGTDCSGDLVCFTGLPDGYCTARCIDGCPDGTLCTSYAGQDLCLKLCVGDADCREGYTCRSGVCQTGCVTDAECQAGESCQGGGCTARGIGAACTTPDECDSGSCAKSLPGGYCTQGCASAADCPTGTECVTYGGQSFCFDACLNNGDCRAGYVCSGGVCDRACTGDADCAGGEVCRDGACVGAGVGQTCELGTDCPSPLGCNKSVPGGYCTQVCTTGADCPEGSTCGTMKGSRTCLAVCRTDADCHVGQQCFSGACNVPCAADADCGAGFYCDFGECREVVEGGGDVTVLDLGTVSAGSTQVVNVDAQTYAMNVVVVGSQGTFYAINSVQSPSGQELVNWNDLMAGPLRVVPDDQVATAQIPNSNDAAVQMQPGTWRFSFYSDYSRPATVKVLLRKSADGLSKGGLVPLNVFLAPNAFPGVSSSNASTNTSLREILGRWRAFYRDQAGVDLGSIHYYDVSSSYTDITSDAEYQEMFAASGRDDGLNLFFVRSISLGGDSAVAGVAGGIPGPPRTGGTGASGVVIEVQENTRLTGDDAAHECGHFLGLFHTTEFDGTDDLLSDTPHCADVYRCTDSYYHLMFPALTGVADTLTPQSAEVVRSNANIR